jgi:hypothetical protein
LLKSASPGTIAWPYLQEFWHLGPAAGILIVLGHLLP